MQGKQDHGPRNDMVSTKELLLGYPGGLYQKDKVPHYYKLPDKASILDHTWGLQKSHNNIGIHYMKSAQVLPPRAPLSCKPLTRMSLVCGILPLVTAPSISSSLASPYPSPEV